ncbi:MAG: ABC transporter ATP-binding protein [Spirochaetes bacterium]|nr:ABC transporter ATP-binding protein [Spirochaetota bacterium]
MVVVENISKRFGSLEVLENVNFRVEKGEVLTLLGPNGAGKSTLMRILTGILLPSTGVVWIDGVRMDVDPVQAKRHLGYLPEQTPLYPELTVEEYLCFVAAAKGVEPAKQKERVREVIHHCDIEEYRNRRMGTLSKGTLRRVGIAQAIVNDPSVLILDEPTSGLDPSQALSFRELISALRPHTAIVLSTHLMADASQLGTRVLFIHKGRILLEDTVEGLKRRFAERDVYQLKIRVKGERETEDSILKVLSGIEGVQEVKVSPLADPFVWDLIIFTFPDWNPTRSFLPLLGSRNWELIELQQKTMSLEEVFAQITARTQEVGTKDR